MKKILHLQKKTSISEQILLLEEQVRILKLENKKLQEERKAQLNIIERLTENQNSDFRKETENDWTTVPPNKNSKGLSSRQNIVLELQNLHLPLQVEDLPQQILIEKNSSTASPEEKNTILDNVIRRRSNICTTERYIQTQQQLQKSKVVPGNNTYAGTLREGRKILMIGDSHIRRVKRDKLQNLFDNVKFFVRYFSGAKTEDLRHYIIPSLLKEKPDTVVIHVGSNNITHRIFEDFNAGKLADEIIDIGKMCSQYGVKYVIFSSIFGKNSIKLGKMISQVNGAVYN